MFTQECFIRKNTQEIRDKLIEIGYSESAFYCGDLSNLCVNVLGNGEYDEANDYAPLLCNAIDCGDNEDLFLAIAALRDDSDLHQYFILDCNISCASGNFKPKGTFILCKRDTWFRDFNKDGNVDMFSSTNIPAHKATVEELIEHFK